MTCYCESCASTPRLTYTRAYLMACLASDIAQTDGGDPEAIKARLARFGAHHDPDTTQRLTEAVRRAWKIRGAT